MSMTDSKDLIARLVELREKATAGAQGWRVRSSGGNYHIIECELLSINGLMCWYTVATLYFDTNADMHAEGKLCPKDDAAFIIALVNAFPALAARLAEVEGERDFWRAGAEGCMDGGLDYRAKLLAAESLNTTLASRLKEAEGAIIEAIATYDMAISATSFTKPRAGQIIVNKARAEALLLKLRAALKEPTASIATKPDIEG